MLDAATAAGKHGATGEGGSVHIYARVGCPLGACHQHTLGEGMLATAVFVGNKIKK